MTPTLKLTYYHPYVFNAPGRAELARLTLVVGGIAFDDHRIENAELAALKPTLPLGQIPVMEIDGVTYPQSLAIARYAAKLSGLTPTDLLEALKVDVLIDTLDEVRAVTTQIRWQIQDEALKAAKSKTLLDEKLPKSFGLVENYLAGPFLLGDKLSLADLYAFDIVENSLKPVFPTAFDLAKYPKIEALVNAVKANERVAAYLAK